MGTDTKEAIFARYEVRDVEGFNTANGYAFTAIIHRDGRKFLVVEQSGHGGSNMYRPATRGEPGAWRGQVKTLQEDAARYVGSRYVEVEDTFVSALMDAVEEREWLMESARGAKTVLFQVGADIGTPKWRQFPNVGPAKTAKAVEKAKAQGTVVRVAWCEGKALKVETFGK